MKISEEGRGLPGFHSKGPVFEELALCKEWAFFQHYHFHRYLVFLWVFGCWVFSFPWGPQFFSWIINTYSKTESVLMMGGHVLRWHLLSSL